MLEWLRKLRSLERTGVLLALYGKARGPIDYQGSIDAVCKVAGSLALPKADWISAVGKGFQGAGMQFEKGLNRLKKVDFAEIDDVEINSAIPGIDDRFTGWRWYANVGKKEGMVLFCMEEALRPVQHSEMIEWASNIYPFFNFRYGYMHRMDIMRGPQFYAGGYIFRSAGRKDVSRMEKEEISKWDHLRVECHKQDVSWADFMRDVYEINFLSEMHLNLMIEGMSLRNWIMSSPARGALSALVDEMYVWRVPSQKVRHLRRRLGGAHLLVGYGGYTVPSGGLNGDAYGSHRG